LSIDVTTISVGEIDIDEKIATLLPGKLFCPDSMLDVHGKADAEKRYSLHWT
jgi:hypothetical protein